jgi:hypothetical protein
MSQKPKTVYAPELASFFVEAGRITKTYGMHYSLSYLQSDICFAIFPHNRKWQAFYFPLKQKVEVCCFKYDKEIKHFEFYPNDETLYYASRGCGLVTVKEIVDIVRQSIKDGLAELNRRVNDYSIPLSG